TNKCYVSWLPEVPINALSLRCPGGLLDAEQVRELLRDTVAIPRSVWTNHTPCGRGWRYVFSLVGRKEDRYVIDERMGAFALVFFPDGTYRCVVGPGYDFVPALQQHAPADSSQPSSSGSNRTSSAAGSRR